MKKMLAFVLALVLVLSCTGAALAWNVEGTQFPLAETAHFEILTSGYRGANIKDIANNKDWQDFCKALNVEIEFIFLGEYDAAETRDNLQNRLLSEDYGDAIMSFYVDTLNMSDIEDMAAAGMLVPLTQYVTDANIMPNMVKNVTGSHPNMLNNMKSSTDGEVYYLAGVTEINAYTSNEGVMMVNSEWLNAWKTANNTDKGPQTLADFENMLAFFRDSDLNGNGVKDEIPYFIAQGTYMGCCTLEHAMGMYGIATKDSTADMNIMIDDNGYCYFAHTTDTYKEALKTFSKWYKEGFIWEEIFTGNAETITNTMAKAKDTIGLFNACEDLVGFEPLLPPAIEGYTAKYHMHPSVRVGVKQPHVVITDKCKDPALLCSVLDVLYDFDNYMKWTYGSTNLSNGYLTINEEGKYVFDKTKANANPTTENRPIFDFLCHLPVDTLDGFGTLVDVDSYYGNSARVKGYTLYAEAGIWNPVANLWPRCTLSEEYAADYAFLYTDVSATLAEYRAKFLVGELDIDAEWDNFQSKLQKLGIEEMRDIIQKTYDAYLNK